MSMRRSIICNLWPWTSRRPFPLLPIALHFPSPLHTYCFFRPPVPALLLPYWGSCFVFRWEKQSQQRSSLGTHRHLHPSVLFSPAAVDGPWWLLPKAVSSVFCTRSSPVWLALTRASGRTPLPPTSSLFPSLPDQSAFQPAWVCKLCFRSHTVSPYDACKAHQDPGFCTFLTFTPAPAASATRTSLPFLEHGTTYFHPRACALLILFSALACLPPDLYVTLPILYIKPSLLPLLSLSPLLSLFFSFQIYYHLKWDISFT